MQRIMSFKSMIRDIENIIPQIKANRHACNHNVSQDLKIEITEIVKELDSIILELQNPNTHDMQEI